MGKRSLAIIIASFFTVFIGFAVRNSYGILLPAMLPSLSISKTEAGMIYSSFFMAYTAFSPVLGLLADRISIRIVLTLFLVILAIGTFLMGYSSSLIGAIFSFLLAGIGASACWVPIVPLLQRWTSVKRRGMTLAFIDMGAPIGIAMTSVVLPIIVMASNWRVGWKSLGALATLIAGINFLLVRDYPVENPNLQYNGFGGYQKKLRGRVHIKIFKDRAFLLIGASYLFIGFSVVIPLTFISTYAVQELMFRYDVAARLITIIAIASIAGRLVLCPLSDTIGRVKTIIVCEILVAISILGVLCLPSFLTTHLSMVILGFGFGAIWPLYALCAPDFFSKTSTGFIVGFWTLFLGIGFVLSPIIAGWIADVTGRFMWSFILAVAASMISIVLMYLVRKKVSSDIKLGFEE